MTALHTNQKTSDVSADSLPKPEPRWATIVAVLAVGGLHLALPSELTIGPRWMLPLLVSVLLLSTAIAHRTGRVHINQVLGYLTTTILTLAMLISLTLLVLALPRHIETPGALLRSAAALWTTNVLVFALWYWRLDAGGPHQRDLRVGHPDGAFLFPQMTMDDNLKKTTGEENWSPGFVDYLFLAFNTSTALSPTDTSVLSRWAKLMMMVQATISLSVIALLAARAVNIL